MAVTLLSNLLLYTPGHSGFSSYVRRVMPGIPGHRLLMDGEHGAKCSEGDWLPDCLPSSRLQALLHRLSLSQHGLNVKAVLASAGLSSADVAAVYSPYCDVLFGLPLIPQVITCHDLTPLHCANSRKARWRYRFWTPVHLRRAQKVIAISHFVADQLMAFGVPSEKIEVVWNGVTIERDPVRAPASHDLVMLARHDANKNVGFVVKSFAKLLVKKPEWPGRLVVVGRQGRQTALLKRLQQQLPRPDRLQLVESMDSSALVELLRQSLALVSASSMEGFDYPVLEAKAEGLPTLISAIPVHKELHHESSLFFDHTGNGEDLSHGVIELVNNHSLWNQLSTRGLKLAASLTLQRQQDEIKTVINPLIR